MIGYASRTGTRRNLDALRAAGWRLMVSAKGVLRTEGFRYALDNGAWNAHVAGLPFDEEAFLRAYGLLGRGADFAVLPDIVAGGAASLAFSRAWLARLEPVCPLMLAVQDGMEPGDVERLAGPALGIFVGGSTEWKEATMMAWGHLARARGAKLHVGRVNTARRIRLCAADDEQDVDDLRDGRRERDQRQELHDGPPHDADDQQQDDQVDQGLDHGGPPGWGKRGIPRLVPSTESPGPGMVRLMLGAPRSPSPGPSRASILSGAGAAGTERRPFPVSEIESMNVGELKKALEGVPDHFPVLLGLDGRYRRTGDAAKAGTFGHPRISGTYFYVPDDRTPEPARKAV